MTHINAKVSGKRGEFLSFGTSRPDGLDVFDGEAAIMMSPVSRHSISGNYILPVVRLIPGPEMIRIAARRIVAGMKAEQVPVIPNRKKQCDSGRSVGLSSPPEAAISNFISASRPQPTFIPPENFNPAPELEHINRPEFRHRNHKKAARQCKCSDSSFDSRQNVKVSAVLAQPKREYFAPNTKGVNLERG